MRKLIIIALLGMAAPAVAQDDYANCWQSSANDLLPAPEDATQAAQCEAACLANESCTAWNFRPHSFDSEAAGTCQNIEVVFQLEESDRAFCGQIER